MDSKSLVNGLFVLSIETVFIEKTHLMQS